MIPIDIDFTLNRTEIEGLQIVNIFVPLIKIYCQVMHDVIMAEEAYAILTGMLIGDAVDYLDDGDEERD